MSSKRPVIAVSMGDPGGIGPEVLAKALADPSRRRRAHFRIYGLVEPFEQAADAAGIDPYWWRADAASGLLDTALAHDVVLAAGHWPDSAGPVPGRPSAASGDASYRWVESAIADCRRPSGYPLRADGLVTGPISKQAWALAGHGRYPGHTELLASRFGARRHAMMFEAPKLRVILATGHVPLMDLRNVLTIGRVFDAIDLGHGACRRLGVARPRIAVCGLNPHAGEHGLLGDEDARLIEPAVRLAVEAGIDVRGPLPADTVFGAAVAGKYDLVVAMYHDQGLIPIKLLAFDRAVNLTVGLPVPRTSPDHGTAFDIAGRNKADAGSMAAAIDLAVRLARGGPTAG